jgi:hypothetical protein
MARAPVPTAAQFRALCVRPDAFEDIPDATIEAKLPQWVDKVASYCGKHTRNVIVAWDGGFELAVIACVGYDLMTHRGFNKSNGADIAVENRYKQEIEWCGQVARGEVEPYVDDGADYDDDAVIGSTSEKSDEWTEYGPSRCGCE